MKHGWVPNLPRFLSGSKFNHQIIGLSKRKAIVHFFSRFCFLFCLRNRDHIKNLESEFPNWLLDPVIYERFIPFSFFVNDEKWKNQLYCLCLKMTADFGNFVAKNDEKQKMKWTRQKARRKEWLTCSELKLVWNF